MLFELVQLGTVTPVPHGPSSLPDILKYPPAVAGLVAGLLLWALGGRILKFALSILGLAVGGGLGSILPPALGIESVAGFPAHLVGLALGAVVGLALAISLFRFAMIVAGSGVLALAGALIGLIYVNVSPADDSDPASSSTGQAETSPDTPPSGDPHDATRSGSSESIVEELGRESIEEFAETQSEVLQDRVREVVPEETAQAVEETVQRVQQFVTDVVRAFDYQYNERLDGPERIVVAGFVVLGLAGGALIGLAMPQRSAAMLTSLAGSAIWLASLAWLAEAMELPGRQWLTSGDHASLKWLIAWPVVAIIGMAFQFRNLKHRAEDAPSRGRGPRGGREDDRD